MQISVHAFPLSDPKVTVGQVAPSTQNSDAIKDGVKTEQQSLGLPQDRVSLSDQTKSSQQAGDNAVAHSQRRVSQEDDKLAGAPNEKVSKETDEAKEEAEQRVERQHLKQLKQRDREVRAHELAHAVVGGAFAGSLRFEYTRGPDGVQYATGGEVSIDTSPVAGDPQATIEKARVIRAAALAPAEPSSTDRAVAAKATQMSIDASAELAKLQIENQGKDLSSQDLEKELLGGTAENSLVNTYERLKSDADRGSYFDELV